MVNDEHVFASDKVVYHGQIIGALACTNKAEGKAALKKVRIEYEDLPFILNLKHARDNLRMDLEVLEYFGPEEVLERHQEPTTAWTQEDTIELQGSLRVGAAEHFYMEPNSVIAVPLGEKDELVVYHSTQEVTPTQKRIAQTVGLPMHKVIVKNKRTGGAFGGKERMHVALIASVSYTHLTLPTIYSV